ARGCDPSIRRPRGVLQPKVASDCEWLCVSESVFDRERWAVQSGQGQGSDGAAAGRQCALGAGHDGSGTQADQLKAIGLDMCREPERASADVVASFFGRNLTPPDIVRHGCPVRIRADVQKALLKAQLQ